MVRFLLVDPLDAHRCVDGFGPGAPGARRTEALTLVAAR